MASAVFSRRSRPLCCAVNAADKPKTSTNCLILGRIFSAGTRFFRSLEKEVDAALNLRMVILMEMQLRDMPETEPAGQFMTQIMPRVFEGRQRFALFPFVSPDGYPHRSMAPIRTDMRFDHFHREQA